MKILSRVIDRVKSVYQYEKTTRIDAGAIQNVMIIFVTQTQYSYLIKYTISNSHYLLSKYIYITILPSSISLTTVSATSLSNCFPAPFTNSPIIYSLSHCFL